MIRILKEGWTKITLSKDAKNRILETSILDWMWEDWYADGKSEEEINELANQLLSKTWYVIDDEEDREDFYEFPYSLYIDGRFEDYLSRNFGDELIKITYASDGE